MASHRVTDVSKGSKQDADMSINVKHLKRDMFVRTQEPITCTSNEEAVSVCKFTYPQVGCGFKFHTRRGASVNGKAKFALTVSPSLNLGIQQTRESTESPRQSPPAGRTTPKNMTYDTWESRSHLHHETITEFEKLNGFYDYD